MFRVRGRQWLPALYLSLGALCLCGQAVGAQDDRSVKSPDGQVEFRLFTALPEGAILNCLAYQVLWKGKPVLDTSYLGLHLLYQEPMLADNLGLSADKPIHEANYNGLWADYLQTSTTGRRIQFEVRVWNDGVAFRYIVPRSALLFDLLILDDISQFRFPAATGKLPESAALPYIREMSGAGWLGIYSQDVTGYPKAGLVRFDERTMVSHLPGGVPEEKAAFQTQTPWTGPWHIVVLGADREKLGQSEMLRALSR